MPLPNFLIIGERRSGTTTLANWVKCHPEIFLHPQMDIGFFIDKELVGSRIYKEGKADYDKWEEEHTIADYEQLFAKASTEHKAIGEKSADYLFWEQAHERIKKMLPDIKLVISLRNPIERAYSMFWNELGKGRETVSFEKAIMLEEDRISNSDYAKDHLSYIARGYYDVSIEKLHQTFSPNQIFVFILEHAIENPVENLKSLYNFLGVNVNKGYDNINKRFNANWTLQVKPFWKKNAFLKSMESFIFKMNSSVGRILIIRNKRLQRKFIKKMSKPFRFSKDDIKIDEHVKLKLRKRYEPHIKNLEKILDKDLSIWLED